MVTFSTVHRSKFEKEVEKKVSQPLSQLWTPFSKPRGEKERAMTSHSFFFKKKNIELIISKSSRTTEKEEF